MQICALYNIMSDKAEEAGGERFEISRLLIWCGECQKTKCC